MLYWSCVIKNKRQSYPLLGIIALVISPNEDMTWLTVTTYLCHKWPRICSVCRNQTDVGNIGRKAQNNDDKKKINQKQNKKQTKIKLNTNPNENRKFCIIYPRCYSRQSSVMILSLMEKEYIYVKVKDPVTFQKFKYLERYLYRMTGPYIEDKQINLSFPFRSTCVHPRFLVGFVLLEL